MNHTDGDWPKGTKEREKLRADFKKAMEGKEPEEHEQKPKELKPQLNFNPPELVPGMGGYAPGKTLPEKPKQNTVKELRAWTEKEQSTFDQRCENRSAEFKVQLATARENRQLDLQQHFDRQEMALGERRSEIEKRLNRGGLKGLFSQLAQGKEDRQELKNIDRQLGEAKEQMAKDMASYDREQTRERERFADRQTKEYVELSEHMERVLESGRIPENHHSKDLGHDHSDDKGGRGL